MKKYILKLKSCVNFCLQSLKHNFFHNWVDPADWTERDLARMTPEAREDYERFILRYRPKYIPMKPEKLAKLSPEDRQEYENSLKIT